MIMQGMNGKVVFVTGGGRGLGAAICRALAADGAQVVIGEMQESLARQCASELASAGGRAEAMQLDVGAEDGVCAALDETARRYGRLDVLINNAGVDVTAPIDELTVSDWDRVIRTNLRGPFLTSRHALQYLGRNGGGHIINVASTAAKRTWPNATAYHASKWGLLGLSHALHAELRPKGIKVTAIVAGGMKTPFLLDRFPDIDVDTLQEPANVAEVIRFVLSLPAGTVVPEVMVLPMKETSWP
jgi:NAD(P)-dependent dehydrogenase (short-subunit alcohol dehydrogenase family)